MNPDSLELQDMRGLFPEVLNVAFHRRARSVMSLQHDLIEEFEASLLELVEILTPDEGQGWGQIPWG